MGRNINGASMRTEFLTLPRSVLDVMGVKGDNIALMLAAQSRQNAEHLQPRPALYWSWELVQEK